MNLGSNGAFREFNTNEVGFVILQIALAYIEGNQQYREGRSSNNESKKFFITGLRRIFNLRGLRKNTLEKVYCEARCGLFHDGMTKRKVWISNVYSDPIKIIRGQIKISPNKFFYAIEKDFKEYIIQLKDQTNNNLRTNFENFLKQR